LNKPWYQSDLTAFPLPGGAWTPYAFHCEGNLSVKTIETHRAHIKEKLGFADANEMVRFAIDWVAQQELG
jgi:hypothetical protein